MPDEMTSQMLAHLFATYGPAALPIIGLLLIIKYLLDKDKEREGKHATEMEAERERTRAERKRADELQAELLKEARSNAVLAEEVKNVVQQMALRGNA